MRSRMAGGMVRLESVLLGPCLSGPSVGLVPSRWLRGAPALLRRARVAHLVALPRDVGIAGPGQQRLAAAGHRLWKHAIDIVLSEQPATQGVVTVLATLLC